MMNPNLDNQTSSPAVALSPEASLEIMQRAVNHFYREAVRANCHSFLEIAGLAEELLKIYRYSLERGIDFRNCHEHSGIPLSIESWHVNYINQKIGCIFNGALTVTQVSPHPSEHFSK